MSWLLIILLAYFLFAIVALGDKFLLSGLPNPKIYSFYVGALGIIVILLIPFIGFFIPSFSQVIISFLSGFFSILAIFFLFKGLKEFEATRIIPAIGALVPIFTFLIPFVFLKNQEVLGFSGTAFCLLIFGGVLINYKKGTKIQFKSFLVAGIAALFFALHFILTKYVYLDQPFWNGFIWIRIGAFFTVLFFLFSKQVRDEIFKRKSSFTRKTGTFFIANQAFGAGALILQHFAISLADLKYLPIITALQGSQYAFLFLLAILISIKAPYFVKEEVSKNVILQKSLAILFIIIGIVILSI